jgi:hypothetical protein
MREINFKGFQETENGSITIIVDGEKVVGEWVYGYYCVLPEFHYDKEYNLIETKLQHQIYGKKSDGFGCGWTVVVPETVCQSTGLTDKNNTVIWEGDFIHIDEDGHKWSVEYDESEACFIAYNQINSERRFNINFDDPSLPIVEIYEGNSFIPEVIGNIYELNCDEIQSS